MITDELRKYVISARAAGIQSDAIRRELLQLGWAASDISDALKEAESNPLAVFNPDLHVQRERRRRLVIGAIIIGFFLCALVSFIVQLYF